ncbi:hypothetical protein QFC22_006080 [Naganishia vaughanmartiniae]|uniref:Uncharacterized protein n=1 Tax=Naganishia vaughanmartiniae TaxID=1424756 RepID=A0ACC2WP63_9TREE|nr:hypothetical protein QFC22_006080 [Naganishia vaughanmartiniae]
MSTGSTTQTQQIISLLERDKIVPDVLPSAPDLQGKLDIVYPTHVISMGETADRVITKDIPVVRFTPFPNSSFQAGPEARYTVIMVDSDLTHPNDRLSGQVRHWLLSGVVFEEQAGTDYYIGKPREGVPPLTEYLECAPGPPVSSSASVSCFATCNVPYRLLGFPFSYHANQGHAHRYTFLLARESTTSAPQATDFPSTQLTHAPSFPKTSENLADRSGFNVHEYLEKKQMPVVGVSYFFVGPDVESLIDNVGVMGRTVVDKVMGR